MIEQQKCPQCGTEGQLVKNFTVRRIVNKKIKDKIADADFFLCKNPQCEIGYYNNEVQKTVHKSEFKKPLWYKVGADPIYACYCTNITEDDIVRTVIETGLRDMRHIMFYLKGRFGNTCRYKNPQGICCVDTFNSMIVKGLRIKQNRKIPEELNPALKEEIARYSSLQEDSIVVEIEKLNQEISEKEPTSTCGCSTTTNKGTRCC
ncbi:MAG: hypothetical protein HGN29_03480 [Asgard group archaeon]|nr:hypothetical protein [Asgard group archaeon]